MAFAALAALMGVVVSAADEADIAAFREARFGIFIHWGLYANYAQGEWYQQEIGMDTATY